MNQELLSLATNLHTHPLLSTMTNILSIADDRSRWITGNKVCADLLGYKSVDSMYLTTYFDMNVKAAEYGDLFVKADLSVMQARESKKYLEIYEYSDSLLHVLLVHKHPIISQLTGDVLGTFTSVVDLDSHVLTKINNGTINVIRSNSSNQSFEICSEPEDSPLTKKESLVLFFLLQGYTSKYIAKILSNSPRTIEHTIANIKKKFNCSTRDQVIEIAHSLGYNNIIPESVFK